MGQNSRPSGGEPPSASSEKRKKEKSALVLDGLVADLARRTQSAMEGTGPTQHLESIRAIHKQLGQIQKLERPFVTRPKVPDTAARLRVLSDWLQLRGVLTEGLKLEGGLPEGAGVVAQKAFRKDQLLCTIPAQLMMTTATAVRSTDDMQIIFNADPVLLQMPALVLSLHLLFEKHRLPEDPSAWAGYIASLPGQTLASNSGLDETENFIMPLAFSLGPIEALKGTAVQVEMHKALRNYARQYAHVRLLLKQLKGRSAAINRANAWFTWAEFRWAASIVMTRQNPIPGTSEMGMGRALALIPYLDMFNHEEGDITCHFAIHRQQMELTAKRDFSAGEQVYISYGSRPNSALLLYSGFMPIHNSKDRIKIPVELSSSDPLYFKKTSLLKWLQLPVSGWLDLCHDGTPSPELASWVKVAIMQDLSVVTDNLRMAIASRAQETAAVLQLKVPLREAEEKARSLGLQLVETEPALLQMDSNISNKGSIPAEVLKQAVDHRGTQSAHNRSEKQSYAGGESLNGSATPLQTASNLHMGNNNTDHGRSVLWEHLFPKEAALLSQICRLRISEFGDQVEKEFDSFGQPPSQGLGVEKALGPISGQPKSSSSKELSMALTIRRQEQLTLMRALDRGSKFQQTHASECYCCHQP